MHAWFLLDEIRVLNVLIIACNSTVRDSLARALRGARLAVS
jgi:hypothetical protein